MLDLIEGNLHLVGEIVDAFIAQHPTLHYLKDDLYGDGALGLTEAVEKIDEEDIKNLGGYLYSCIRNSIVRALDSYDTIRMPRTSNDSRAEQEEMTDYLDESSELTQRAKETLNHILKVCTNQTERRIIRMRAEGFNDREIAEELDLTRKTVGSMRKVILRRYEVAS